MRRYQQFVYPLLIALSLFIVAVTLHATSRQAMALQHEELEKVGLIAEAMHRMTNLEVAEQEYSIILEVIQRNETVPVVLTDANRRPISLRNVDQKYHENAELIPKLLEELAQEHTPITIALPSGQNSYIYYGSSEALKGLRYFPYIQLSFIAVVVLLGYLVFAQSRQSEQNRIWVGLAKETAHQLGTPISSLLAWMHLMEEEKSVSPEMLQLLGMDIERLRRIADRFSKIGATPQLEDTDLEETITQSISYMQPRISQKISLLADIAPLEKTVRHNAVLMQWVLENLIRNAVDAITGDGVIAVRLSPGVRHVIIDCSDNGKGMTRAIRRRVFRPGYSSKTRGWGLGLSLSRRIVRNYHHGHLFIHRSDPNRGTTFRIMLPYRQPGET